MKSFFPNTAADAKSGLCKQLKPIGEVKAVKFSFRATLNEGCTEYAATVTVRRKLAARADPCYASISFTLRKEGQMTKGFFFCFLGFFFFLFFRKPMKLVRKRTSEIRERDCSTGLACRPLAISDSSNPFFFTSRCFLNGPWGALVMGAAKRVQGQAVRATSCMKGSRHNLMQNQSCAEGMEEVPWVQQTSGHTCPHKLASFQEQTSLETGHASIAQLSCSS